MTYSISVSGHKNTKSDEESAAFEKKVEERSREFVKSLKDLGSENLTANGYFGKAGQVDLTQEKAS